MQRKYLKTNGVAYLSTGLLSGMEDIKIPKKIIVAMKKNFKKYRELSKTIHKTNKKSSTKK